MGTVTDLQARTIHELRAKGDGYKAIASATDLSRDAVRNYCRGHGLAGYAEPLTENQSGSAVCPNCGISIAQPSTGRKRKFCSDECRRAWWSAHPAAVQRNESALYRSVCDHCGKEFSAYGSGNRRYCSHVCYIADRFKKSVDFHPPLSD